MNVLEPKYLDTKTNFMYDVFKFGAYPVRLVGTGSMLSQDYPADFDFLCQVPKIFPADYVNNQFQKIFDRMLARPELFFIEFKLQKKLKKGEKEAKKYKVFKTEDINYDFFEAYYDDNVELCKIDAIIYLEGNIFKEVSCIYFFGKVELDMKSYIKALLDDQKYYYDAGKYYKSLKRLMLAAKYENPPDTNLIVLITRFFNSAVGKAYAIDNQISACEIYKERYKDSQAHLRVKLFISAIGLGNTPADKLEEVSKQYQKLYNGEALKLYKKYKLPVGHLPAWGTITGGAKKKVPKGFHIMPDGKLMKDSEHKVGGAIQPILRNVIIRWLRQTYPDRVFPALDDIRDAFMFFIHNQGTPEQIEAESDLTIADWATLMNDAFVAEGGAKPKKSKKKVGGIIEPIIRPIAVEWFRANYGNMPHQFIPDSNFVADLFDDFIATGGFPPEIVGASTVLTTDDWKQIKGEVIRGKRKVGGAKIMSRKVGGADRRDNPDAPTPRQYVRRVASSNRRAIMGDFNRLLNRDYFNLMINHLPPDQRNPGGLYEYFVNTYQPQERNSVRGLFPAEEFSQLVQGWSQQLNETINQLSSLEDMTDNVEDLIEDGEEPENILMGAIHNIRQLPPTVPDNIRDELMGVALQAIQNVTDIDYSQQVNEMGLDNPDAGLPE